MYRTHQTAKTYGTRPSALLGLTSKRCAWIAYQYDSAASALGLWTDAKLAEMTGGKKPRPKHKLDKLLGDGPRASEQSGPTSLFTPPNELETFLDRDVAQPKPQRKTRSRGEYRSVAGLVGQKF